MRVKDIMSHGPVTIRGEESCFDAALRMRDHRIRHLPVVDRRGLLEGMITDRDLRHYLLSPTAASDLGRRRTLRLLEHVRVADVMSSPACVTTADEGLEAAVARMRDQRVGSLPVVDGRQLIGIITETDLLRRLIDAEDEATLGVTDVVVSFP